MDWVLLDVPCSGSGTLRRNPDMKWKWQEKNLTNLLKVQKEIFQKAFTYLKPGGKIVYATCSLFHEENQEQISHFQKNFPIKLVGTPLAFLPQKGGMDGFFGAVMEKEP